MTITKKIFAAAMMLMIAVVKIQAQDAVVVSSNPGPGLHVAVNWAPATFPGAVKYNVFRKNDGAASYPGTPLNPTPITVMSNCVNIRSILITSPDSAEWKIIARSLSDTNGLFNPCSVSSLAAGSQRKKRLALLSKTSMPIAIVAGLGYKDNTVVNGTAYRYRIVALNASNTVVGTVATDLLVTAGVFSLAPPPPGVVAEPGDDKILVRWDDVA